MIDFASQLPILMIVIPLFSAPLCVLLGGRQLSYVIALIVTWCTFAISLACLFQVIQTGPIHYEIGNWNPPYGIELVIDGLSGFVLMFVSALAAIVLTYGKPSIDKEIPHSKHYLFYATYLLCMTGLMGMCITGDLFNVFVFLEISSLSSYALISLGKSRRAPLAALQYLILGTIGATFFLIGIGLLYQMTGTLNMADIAGRLDVENGGRTLTVAFAFMTIGLFIKMALFPLHTWLPNAYTYAPSVVTAFIAATATKVSVYAFIRLIFGIFTPEFAFQTQHLDNALLAMALTGIFVASTAAIYQDNVKRLLAYSSIGQIGYMLLGIGLVSVGGLTATIVHMFNHALIKGGLFMAMGCFALRIGSVKLVDLRGAAKTMPWTSLAFAIGGLGLIGVPLTAGFISKWLLLTSSFEAGRWPVAALMLVSSLLALVYVWRVVEALYFAEPSESATKAEEAPMSMLIPLYVVIGATIVFGVWTDWSAGMAQHAAEFLFAGGVK
ncbi:monovalent cation/H+ antiporter subunit D family protein [Mariniblastus fucicola]|uniref:Na(+)/H(+) antiporter subunit D1 n=1 Tax=Mariniblastus fucicola TaxID=980251 RepID=A0A5B9PBX0_9BACT|nr:monovalent cation/H+ antiporter subunit D family protein [Mariniblastus fucicola]QEG24227.1 Na(+)/H(+) antiporter subunit D1 [Mariniblastus fucicola]